MRSLPHRSLARRSPGGGRRARVLIALALALAAVLAVSYASGQVLCLEVREEDSGRLAALRPAPPGQTFTIWFLHSYDRAFFAEHYRVEGPGRIILTHMTFKSNLNGEGFEYHDFHLRPDGVGELRNINEPRHPVRFRLGSPDLADHTLIMNGERLRLCRVAPPGSLLDLVAVEEPRWRLWWRRLVPGRQGLCQAGL